jgi:hypothetical protein
MHSEGVKVAFNVVMAISRQPTEFLSVSPNITAAALVRDVTGGLQQKIFFTVRAERKHNDVFGRIEISVPRARLNTPEGRTTERKSQALRAYQRRTLAADALIAASYLAGTNTRRVRRALAALFGGREQRQSPARGERHVASVTLRCVS